MVWMCPNEKCSYTEKIEAKGLCPQCGTKAKQYTSWLGEVNNLKNKKALFQESLKPKPVAEKRAEDLSRREEELSKREQEIIKREQEVSRRAEDLSRREQEIQRGKSEERKSLEIHLSWRDCLKFWSSFLIVNLISIIVLFVILYFLLPSILRFLVLR